MKHQHLFRQWLIGCLCCYAVTVQGQTSLVQLVDIPAGQFYMGGIGQGETFDEAPAVVYVSYHDAVAFCEWLSQRE